MEAELGRLQREIEDHAFVRASAREIAAAHGMQQNWIFDLRAILLKADVLKNVSTLFWNTFSDAGKIQIGGIETAGIPLVTAFVLSAEARQKGCTGFFIRKSRKKEGLMQIVEGVVRKDVPVVLVDDLMNTGKSMLRQIEVAESLGLTVQALWTILRFRDKSFYKYLTDHGIRIESLFELNDFTATLGIRNQHDEKLPPARPYKVVWKFSAGNPTHSLVVPKSCPVLDEKLIYLGSDDGTFYALDQKSGKTVWTFKVGPHPRGKGILSSPALYKDTVYFGAYDGNMYALDSATGKKKWVNLDADWIGSSPAIAAELELLFVGLEFGLWRKRGGISALDLNTGKTVWSFRDMPCLTHSSPLYIKEHEQVVIGSNDGAAYLFDARTGDLVWKFASGTPTEQELDSGFSEYDIKESFAYDEERDLIVFGNMRGDLCFVDRASGESRGHFKADFAVRSTPLIVSGAAIAASLDKYLYCIDLDSFQVRWKWHTGARIFGRPVLIDGSVYIGSNSGILTELDPKTGKELSSFTVTERIVNNVVQNPKTKRFFLPTFANELYCLEKISPHSAAENK